MIKLPTIPTKPRKEDFLVSELNVSIANADLQESREKHKKYKDKNENNSYFLGFISTCIIAAIIITSINPKLSGFGLIFCSVIFGIIGMFPIGFILSNIFQKVGDKIEPSRKPQTDTLKRASEYVIAVEEYEKGLKILSNKYPELESAHYNEAKYNELCKNKAITVIENMLHQVRIRSLSCTAFHLNRVFNNLDIIGFKNIKEINKYYHINEVEKDGKKYALTFCDPITTDKCNILCEVMKEHGLAKGIIISPDIRIKDVEAKIIADNNIELIALKLFESAPLKILNNEEISYIPAADIPFENIHKVCARYNGNAIRVFVIRIVTEVFEKRSEIFDRIKNVPKSGGMYGIFPIFNNRKESFYGVVYFQWPDEFEHYLEWLSHAIHDYRKEISQIVPSNAGMWNSHKRFTYQFWSSYEYG